MCIEESIKNCIEMAKERQPIRADLYLVHIHYFENRLKEAEIRLRKIVDVAEGAK